MGRNVKAERVRSMENTKRFETLYRGKIIYAEVTQLDDGCHILLTGGDRSHIGAVVVIDEYGTVHEIAVKGHKEKMIALDWAERIFRKRKEPVCVAAGIHFDHLTKAELVEVVDAIVRLRNMVEKG